MMLMNAILGLFDNRENNDVEKMLPKIKKFYQQIPSHRYTTRPVPGNGNTLECDVEKVFGKHEKLKNWLSSALGEVIQPGD
ncbi:Protein of unknown function [Pyronema omphalodes CBS 100304]|uniref:Uncharacterized protein n=1 Tax=Pyronema omphalodes (strain CBS 100304) TaxID=1076935 RepID=U4L7X7_PYROM|nr:Protein of unknown function [Pyronema omphalodes CBS 100304]